jgi:hypothetical protein
MKKLKLVCLIGIAALCALAMVSCDGTTIPSKAVNNVLDDWDLSNEAPLEAGEFFIGFSQATGRSLSPHLARAGADYFEVIFTDGTTVHRTTFRAGRYGRMEAPTLGDYDNSGALEAYIFAGRYDDQTLLGIGVLTNVDNGNPGGWENPASTIIVQSTRRVRFTVQPLATDITTDFVKADPGDPSALPPVAPTPASSDSTFRPWLAGNVNSTSIADYMAKIMIDNYPAPIYLLPPDKNITNAQYDIFTDYPEAVRVATYTGTLNTVTSRGYIWSDGDYAPIEVPASVTNITSNTVVTPIPAAEAAVIGDGFRLMLNIKTDDAWIDPPYNTEKAHSGLGRLSIEIPVVMLTGQDSDNQTIPSLVPAITWYIRGGMNNALIDQGTAFNDGRGSMGGAVMIGVGDVLTGAGGFIVGQTQ